jgi:poly(hydroxyalkanoate) granule-associated protein
MANKTIDSWIREIPQDLLNRSFQVAGAGRDVWLAGLGAVATVEEEGGTLFNDLVDRGQKLEKEGREKVRGFRIADLSKEMRNLPNDLFSRGTEMVGKSRDVWLAGMGALSRAQEEGGAFFNTLVERGQKLENRGMAQVSAVRDEISERQQDVQKNVSEGFENVSEPLLNALRRFGVPTRAEVRDLATSVDVLSKKVDSLLSRLERETQPAAQPAATVASTETTTGPVKESIFLVVSRGEEGWALRKEGRQSDIGVFATKDEALEEARNYAGERAPCRLDIYKKDGTLQDSISYVS